MKTFAAFIFLITLTVQNSFGQARKNNKIWCFDKELSQLKIGDTLSFLQPDSFSLRTFKFFDNGIFSSCNTTKPNNAKSKIIERFWDKLGTWTFHSGTLIIQTNNSILILKSIHSSKDKHLFLVKDLQMGDFSKNNSVFDKSKFHMDFNFGLSENFVDTKTNKCFGNYFILGFGTTVYLKNFFFSYSYNPTSLTKVKHDFSSTDNFIIKEYYKNSWNGNGPYWVNIIKNNFDIGYEKNLNKTLSFTPSVGFFVSKLQVINDSLHDWKHDVGRFYGGRLGFSIRKYFTVVENVRVFIGVNNFFSIYNINNHFSDLGNNFYTFSINFGFKFRPSGKPFSEALSLMSNRFK